MSRFDASKKRPEIIARNPALGRAVRPALQQSSQTKVWTKFLAFWNWNRDKAAFPYISVSGEVNPPLSDEELLSIYHKLQKSCDANETELKDAIGYGERIIASQKIPIKDIKHPQSSSPRRVRLNADPTNNEVSTRSTPQRR